MQVELGDALAKKILVGLGEPRAESFVDVRDCAITAGTVHLASGKMSLEKARADQLNTHRFRLIFGSIVVQSLADSQLRRLTLELHSGATLELSAEAQFASLHQFGIENLASRTTTLRADSAMMRDVALGQIGEGGSIEADYCELNGVEIGIGELLIKIPHAVASELRVEWGGAESPRISAAGLRFGDVTVRHGSTLYQFEGCELINVNYDAAEFSVDLLGIRELGALVQTGAAGASADAAEDSATSFPLLPFLAELTRATSGEVQAELHVSLGFGRLSRTAIHQLSLPLRDGLFDYRKLEHGLSTFEDALLDFSVRQGTLVLEAGVPFLPTRGHGYPIMSWPLLREEQELAESGYVSLACIMASGRGLEAEKAGAPSQPPGAFHGQRLKLQRLGIEDAHLALAVAPTSSSLVPALRFLSAARVTVDGRAQFQNGRVSGMDLIAQLTAPTIRLLRMKLAGTHVFGNFQCASAACHARAEDGSASMELRTSASDVSAQGLRISLHAA
jgi:hypothetical protein